MGHPHINIQNSTLHLAVYMVKCRLVLYGGRFRENDDAFAIHSALVTLKKLNWLPWDTRLIQYLSVNGLCCLRRYKLTSFLCTNKIRIWLEFIFNLSYAFQIYVYETCTGHTVTLCTATEYLIESFFRGNDSHQPLLQSIDRRLLERVNITLVHTYVNDRKCQWLWSSCHRVYCSFSVNRWSGCNCFCSVLKYNVLIQDLQTTSLRHNWD